MFISFFLKALIMNWNSRTCFYNLKHLHNDVSLHRYCAVSQKSHWCAVHGLQVCQRLTHSAFGEADDSGLVFPMNRIIFYDVKTEKTVRKITSTKSFFPPNDKEPWSSPNTTSKGFTMSRMHIRYEDKSFLLLTQKFLCVWWHWYKE